MKISPTTRQVHAFASLFLLFLLASAGFIIYQILIEFMPHHYMTFPLDDPEGRYVINFDGDYWVTYYVITSDCRPNFLKGYTECTEVATKTGNTSITETPEELEKYRDKAVIIEGEFIRTDGSLRLDKKQLCVGKGFIKSCRPSTGPGYWYASPLKIRSIRLAIH